MFTRFVLVIFSSVFWCYLWILCCASIDSKARRHFLSSTHFPKFLINTTHTHTQARTYIILIHILPRRSAPNTSICIFAQSKNRKFHTTKPRIRALLRRTFYDGNVLFSFAIVLCILSFWLFIPVILLFTLSICTDFHFRQAKSNAQNDLNLVFRGPHKYYIYIYRWLDCEVCMCLCTLLTEKNSAQMGSIWHIRMEWRQ